MNIKFIGKKEKWLNSRGGRTTNDVLKNEEGEYVIMRGINHTNVKVYLPSEAELAAITLTKKYASNNNYIVGDTDMQKLIVIGVVVVVAFVVYMGYGIYWILTHLYD